MRADPDDDDPTGTVTFDTTDAADGNVVGLLERAALVTGRFVHVHMQAVTTSGFKITFDRVILALSRDGTRP